MTSTYNPAAQFEVKEWDVDFRQVPTRMLKARVYQPQGPGPFPTLLDLHGGAWHDKDRFANVPMCQAVGEFVTADRAQPGEQRGFAAVGVQLLDGAGQRALDHVAGHVGVVGQSSRRESIEPREVVIEKPAERALVAGEQPFCEPFVLQPDRHASRLPCAIYRTRTSDGRGAANRSRHCTPTGRRRRPPPVLRRRIHSRSLPIRRDPGLRRRARAALRRRPVPLNIGRRDRTTRTAVVTGHRRPRHRGHAGEKGNRRPGA